MMSPKQTSVFVVIAFVALIVFDFYLATDAVKGNTYSERIRLWGQSQNWFYYLMSFGMGVLIAHWGRR